MADVITYRKILTFWLPLAGTGLMMAVEGPYLAAIIARLQDPTVNLAAFGVAFAFAIIIESPVIMLMSASTVLVEDGPSYRALRRFSYGLAAVLTAVQVVVLLPPVFNTIAQALALPADVTRLTHGGLAILLPWPAAIAYRRFRQGLLIRQNLTRRVAYGTIIRLVAMSTTAFPRLPYVVAAGRVHRRARAVGRRGGRSDGEPSHDPHHRADLARAPTRARTDGVVAAPGAHSLLRPTRLDLTHRPVDSADRHVLHGTVPVRARVTGGAAGDPWVDVHLPRHRPVIPGSGDRVAWEAPRAFRQASELRVSPGGGSPPPGCPRLRLRRSPASGFTRSPA